MAGTEPDAATDYQVSPTTVFSRAVWNAVMQSIGERLAAREALEANFEGLVRDGTQAALDMIQGNVGPQLFAISEQITALESQLEDLVSGGTAPNALQLDNKNPSFYLALGNATGSLPVAQVSGVTTLISAAVAATLEVIINGAVAPLNDFKGVSTALGNDANFAQNVVEALAGKLTKGEPIDGGAY